MKFPLTHESSRLPECGAEEREKTAEEKMAAFRLLTERLLSVKPRDAKNSENRLSEKGC
jgi:hypothetical protein